MEVASNLQDVTRRKAVAQFSAPQWSKVAIVVMGEPKTDFKKAVQNSILGEKQKKLDTEFKKKKAEEKVKKIHELQKKKAEAAREKAKKKMDKLREKAKKAKEKKE